MVCIAGVRDLDMCILVGCQSHREAGLRWQFLDMLVCYISRILLEPLFK